MVGDGARPGATAGKKFIRSRLLRGGGPRLIPTQVFLNLILVGGRRATPRLYSLYKFLNK